MRTGIIMPEAICYARTWYSYCYCKLKPPNTGGFKCHEGWTPKEVFDKERRKLAFGSTIPKMYIGRGKRRGHPAPYFWGWCTQPFRFED